MYNITIVDLKKEFNEQSKDCIRVALFGLNRDEVKLYFKKSHLFRDEKLDIDFYFVKEANRVFGVRYLTNSDELSNSKDSNSFPLGYGEITIALNRLNKLFTPASKIEVKYEKKSSFLKNELEYLISYMDASEEDELETRVFFYKSGISKMVEDLSEEDSGERFPSLLNYLKVLEKQNFDLFILT